eukprot:TRINITY_DN8952_c0_g1_i1.p1 TRINITY_DN8952_c0_g1~~TRINITY_DN8952_c0_g1_i1.p1  ORF type:complete len:449 (+),score=45.60 TRINITY_DN8952_c0_g1_i1:921-2267(+)
MILMSRNRIDEKPETQVFQIIAIFSAAYINAVIVGNMTVLIQNMDQAGAAFRDRMDMINEHLRYLRVPPALIEEVRIHYEHMWLKHRSQLMSVDLYRELSPSLSAALCVFQYKEIFDKMPDVNGFSSSFIENLIVKVKPHLSTPEDFLCREGDAGEEMYFISKGKVDVYIEGNWLSRMGEGDFFGEVALMLRSSRRSASCVTVTFCELFSLHKDAMEELLYDFRHDSERFMEIAKLRFHKTEEYATDELMKKFYIDDHGERITEIWKDLKPSRKRNVDIFRGRANENPEHVANTEAARKKEREREMREANRRSQASYLRNPTKEEEFERRRKLSIEETIKKSTFAEYLENVKDQRSYSLENAKESVINGNPLLFAELRLVLQTLRKRYSNMMMMSTASLEFRVGKKILLLEAKIARYESMLIKLLNAAPGNYARESVNSSVCQSKVST